MNIQMKYKVLICFLILVVLLGLFLWLSILQNDFLEENKPTVLGIFLAILALSLSTWVSLRTTHYHLSVVADVNMYSYALQADISSGRKQNIYKEIAKEWLKYSEDYRGSAKLRAYSARSCVWSLIFLALTFLLALLQECFLVWIIPFTISFGFIVLALLIQIFSLDHIILKKLLATIPILHPELQRWDEITEVIKKHDWLKSALESK